MDESEGVDAHDVLRIMVSTDNHLGYYEKDAIRGEDSFIAFEEMLAMAVEEDVDFILLGGDLFHDAVPSQNSLHKCMKLLRTYVFGNKNIDFEILSDQTVNFHNSITDTVNYEDPNLNISIPVFSIHGNHDDPSSFGCLSSLDLLSTTGLVNYIGRCTDLTKVDIKPVLLQKGASKLAIYGLSHIHDERLARLFEKLKVEIECPEGEKDDWFHLMVLHQNRAMRGHKNYLPEEILPDFLNLVIWGHEHDCRIEPEHVPKKDFYISQPGSSVPTSLAEGEAIKKHVGILKIYKIYKKNKFEMQPLPLRTVRPFVFDSIDLDELAADGCLDGADAAEKVREIAEQRIEEMIERAKQLLTGHEKQPKLPLIRLRLIFSREEHMFNAMRFGQTYSSKVANPADIIHFKKSIKRIKKGGDDFDKEAFHKAFKDLELEANSRLEDLLERYFENADVSKQLHLMPTKFISEMTTQMIERCDASAIDNMISNFESKVLERVMDALPNDDEFDEQFKQIQTTFTADEITDLLQQRKNSKVIATNGRNTIKRSKADVTNSDDDLAVIASDDNDLEVTSAKTVPPSGRGRGRGRGARGGTSVATAASKPKTTASNSRARGGASKHTMPQLDVSIKSTRKSPRKAAQPSILESFASSPKAKKAKTYVISDSDDSV